MLLFFSPLFFVVALSFHNPQMSVVNTAGSADITKESKTKLLQNLRDEVVQLKLTATEHQETLDRVIKWFV